MINPIPFEAGKQWNVTKTKLFNLFFDKIRLSFDWRGEDLSFLANLTNLRGVVIETLRTIDLEPLESCMKLDYLVFACKVSKKHNIDLSHLPLKLYNAEDSLQLASIYQNKNLRRISIYKYTGSDLAAWATKSIEHISIENSQTLTSLKGIENFSELKLVEIQGCHNLKRPLLYLNDYPHLRIYVDGVLQK